jgi:threonine dehydratase
MQTTTSYFPELSDIKGAQERLKGVITHTPLMRNLTYSEKYHSNIFFKREDLQVVRSYKIRGAHNKIASIKAGQELSGVVCASAGNHAQGVAYSCRILGVKATIFMPVPTPNQKVEQVKFFGKEWVDVILIGDTFDDAYLLAKEYCSKEQSIFIHPFDDELVIEGQGTVGLEILEDTISNIDYLFMPIGGGGLASGVSSVFKQLSPETKLIGVEPEGAPAMQNSITLNENTTLAKIDKFVDGAAVKRVGEKTFEICKEQLVKVITVPEGLICTTMLNLYNRDAIVVEPAGALSIAALEQYKDEIKGKHVVCVLSGSNNDISRTPEIKERSLMHKGLKHYFIINFPQRVGALREFLVEVLGPTDDIVLFEYMKKTAKEKGPAMIGIELKAKSDFEPLMKRINDKKIQAEYLNQKPEILQYYI